MRDLAVGGCEKWELVSILRNSKNLKRVAICSNRDAAVLEVDTPPHEFFNNHVQPDTILRWHRAGFRAYWRWKSRGQPGRPKIDRELRELIRRMSKENQLCGAPRIHGELLKLGFEIAESTVSKYMIKRRGPPSQSWRTFLRNHADAIAAIDLCVVPTLTFECLFAFLVLGHGRRRLLWFAVTRHPTAEWLAQQIVEAFPWDTAPSYLIRDNDGAYGQAFTNRVRTMGIRDRPISPRSPRRLDQSKGRKCNCGECDHYRR